MSITKNTLLSTTGVYSIALCALVSACGDDGSSIDRDSDFGPGNTNAATDTTGTDTTPMYDAEGNLIAESGTEVPAGAGNTGSTDDGDTGVTGNNTSDTNDTNTTDNNGNPANSDTIATDNGDTTATVTEPGPAITAETISCDSAATGAPVLRLLTPLEFTNTLQDIFPQVTGQWSNTLPSANRSTQGFDNPSAATVGIQQAERLLETAESVGDAVSGSALSEILPCSQSAADQACAADFLGTYGKRLFRRPLSSSEQERYLALFDSALALTDFPTAIKWVTVGLIQSPKALYRSEIGTSAGGSRTLDAFETATELAYTFTNSTPSAALLEQAESGSLGDLTELARTLLDTEAGRQSLHRFFDAYADYPRVGSIARADASSNGINFADINEDMALETRTYISEVLFTQGGNLQDLLTGTTTYPSAALATYYGIGAPSTDYAAVERPTGQGLGLLAQGAFLSTHANPEASSPTRRGLFVSERLLCQPDPPVPEDVDPTVPEPAAGTEITTRQRYEELHATRADCAACHATFDPFGYAFEHFDQAGVYRETENGLEIDSSGSIDVPGLATLTFADQEELMTTLAGQLLTQECFAAYLSTYAFGTTDACLGPSQVTAMQAGTMSIVDAFAALASEPHFTQRSAE